MFVRGMRTRKLEVKPILEGNPNSLELKYGGRAWGF
jgi:hypothetical protein